MRLPELMFPRWLREKLDRIERHNREKLEFIERQNRRLFFSTSTYVGDYTAITWITSGQRIFVDTRDLGIAQHLMFKGFWEKTTNEALLSILPEDGVFVDVGAHYGYHTLTAAQKAKRGRVVAVEPNPRLHELLVKSIRTNQLRQRVTAHHCAVSDSAGRLGFITPIDDPALGHVASDGEPADAPRTEVEVRTLDSICGDLDRIDVIKIDVEGHEWQVLAGGAETIRRHDVALVMEYAPGHIEQSRPVGELHDELRGLGFAHVYRISDEGKLAETSYDDLSSDRALRNLVLTKSPRTVNP